MIDDDDDLEHEGSESASVEAEERKSSRAWLAMITEAEETFEDYQIKADNIDRLYSNLSHMASATRDRQFQLFWANIQVMGPSIYARPPVPVVVPKFKDRRPVYQKASELLERCSVVSFDQTDIDQVMLLLRDDLTILGRGVAWARYETKAESEGETEKVCIEHLDRKDFLHEPARNWSEVGWVARRGWLTRKEMRKRFSKTSGKEYMEASYAVRREDRDLGGANKRQKAAVWEIWSKTDNKVVWVAEGCQYVLDHGAPHLKLEGFFPCPRPVYSTVQRPSLIPVPDIVYYKDQLEEINTLTGRISALAEAVKVRGFYPAGSGEIGDAVEAAVKSVDDRQVLVPISNWAAFGQGGDPIIWLPLEMIAGVITQLVELRKQLIDDVYQIMGLSDIMRGSTDSNETLGAQQLKSQYGSVRIRDKQAELVRIARDLVRITAEIMAENFTKKTLLEMSQLDLPTNADIKKQAQAMQAQAEAQLEQQIQQAQQDPKLMEQAQANPQAAQAMIQQASQKMAAELKPALAKLSETVTVEKVMEFLKDQKTRPFVLDIETDSTISPDEDAQKQRATEFITAVGGLLAQAIPAIQAVPQVAPLMADTLKFAASQFRAGRDLDTSIDEFAEMMKQMGQQPKGDPAADAAQADAQAKQQELQAKTQVETQRLQMQAMDAQAKAQLAQAGLQLEQQKAAATAQLAQAKLQGDQQAAAAKLEADKWKAQLDNLTKLTIAKLSAQTGMQETELAATLEAALGVQEHSQELERMTIDHAHQVDRQSMAQDAAAEQADKQSEDVD